MKRFTSSLVAGVSSYPCFQDFKNFIFQEESFDNVDSSELLGMMDSVDFSDPDQAATALQVLSMVVGEEETTLPPFRNIQPTTTSSTIKQVGSAEETGEEEATEDVTTTTEEPTTTGTLEKDTKDSEAFQGLINVMLKLTTSKNLPGNLTDEDFTKRIVSTIENLKEG